MALKITVRKLVTELGYEVNDAELARYKAQLRGIKAQMGSAVGGMNGVWKDANGRWRNQSGKFAKGVGADFDGMSGKARGFGDTLGGLKTIAASVIGGALIGGASLFLHKLVSVNAETQALKTRLDTLLGPEKATAKFAELEAFAKRTPFRLNEITDAFIRMNSAGFDIGENELQSLGDLAAASGKDMNALTEIMLSANRGMTAMVDNIAGLKAETKGGKILFTDTLGGTSKLLDKGDTKGMLAFFVAAGKSEKRMNSMQKLSQTLGGLWSTLQDNVDAFFRTVGESGVNEQLQELLKLMLSTSGGGDSLAKSIGEGLTLALRGLVAVLRFAQEHADSLRWALKLLTLNRLGLAALVAAPLVFALAIAFGLLAAGVLAALIPIAPFMLALLALGLIVEDLYYFFTGGESAIGDFVGELMKLGVVREIVGWFRRAAQVWSAVFRIIEMVATGVWQRIQLPASAMFAALGGFFDNLLVRASSVLEGLAAIFGIKFDGIQSTVGGVFDTINGYIDGLLQKLDVLAAPLAALAGVDVGTIRKELAVIQGSPGAPAPQGALLAAGAGGRGGGTTNNNATTAVGALNVIIQGSSNMGPGEVAGASEAGVKKALGGSNNRAGAG